MRDVGVSAMSVAIPACRVDLRDFCQWTGGDPEKTLAVVGSAFRIADRDESVYTLAANAVIRLIDQNGLDPRQIGYLALGTESSTDNAAGAVIVKGLVDRALAPRGQSLARNIEVPEFKHACLGGVYALKSALRYVATDGAGRQAIVVAADLAEYARGSTGEPTQGAGAVAMLVEAAPRLFRVSLEGGSSAAYREVDFRKPVRRYAYDPVPAEGRVHDFPVFNGKYSTACYTDAVRCALTDLAVRRQQSLYALLQSVDAFFFHRPYAKMPQDGLSATLVAALAETDGPLEALGLNGETVRRELESAILDAAIARRGDEPFPETGRAVRALRGTEHATWCREKLALGAGPMRELGNLYTAALPAWLAAGLEEAAERGVDLEGKRLMAVGYGSGDAAEAFELEVVPGWREAAGRIGLQAALARQLTLTEAQYHALHERGDAGKLPYPRGQEVVLEAVGHTETAAFSDRGIEYYRWLD